MSVRVGLVGAADQQIEKILKLAGFQVMPVARTDLSLLAQATAKIPDVLVIDLRDDATFPSALGVLKRQHHALGMVIVASRHDPQSMLEAMRAGVSEWVVEPLNGSDLKAAIDRVVVQGAPEKSLGKVFAFLGAKGGVGTTTLAVNVATALRRLSSSPTLLIDLNLACGDASLFLGAEPRFSVVDAIENRHRLDTAFFHGLVAQTKAGPDLLAASDRATLGQVDLRAVSSVIDFAAREYPFVVLDLPRSDSAILDQLELASSITIVANQELATIRAATRLSSALKQRYGGGRVNVVISRYDKASEIGKDDIAKTIGLPIKHLFPSDYRLAVDALNVGRPLVVENHSRLAASYMEFSRGLAGLPDTMTEPARSTSLFGRFGAKR